MRSTSRNGLQGAAGARVAGPCRPRGRARLLAGGVVVLALLLGACSSGGQEAMSDAAGGDAGAGAVEDRARANGVLEGPVAPDEAEGEQGAEDGANRTTVQTRAVIRTGEIHLVAKDLGRARDAVDDLLRRHGGYLAGEDTTNDRRGRPERSTLVLRVPEPAFGTVMSGLREVGRTERTDRSSDDVTTEVIDVDTRVATQEASLRRLRDFLRRATNVDDMIRVESEIATRQAALESLKAQQKYLADQTSMSTITAHLRSPAAPPPADPEEDRGFLAGLSDGWNALTTVLVGAATVAGALLPFAVLLLLLGVPSWLVLRAAVRRRPGPVPATAGPTGDPDA